MATSNLCLSWRRGKTEENSPVWKRLYRRFQLKELLKATKNFHPDRKIGQDCCFTVYEGYIDDGFIYPVRIQRYMPEDHRGFFIEMELLSNLHHPNIVSPIGYCLDGSDRIIVHMHMAHGTLHDHLHSKTDHKSPLSWKRRLEICIGVACGLERLHTGNPVIIHRDIKSRNILLGKSWVAKISNFEISKLVSSSLSESNIDYGTTTVAGTIGYIDPEYLTSGRLTIKSDVYSFGVVLFEVLCCRLPFDVISRAEQINFIPWGRQCVKDGKLGEVLDPRLNGEIAPECLKAYADLAYNCTNEHGGERPIMSDVVKGLQLVLLLQECIEADIPYAPSWLRSTVLPPESSEPLIDLEDSGTSACNSDYEELVR